MIKQYIKQALRMIGENKLLSVISILGTALAICMIMVIVILYVVNTASVFITIEQPKLIRNIRV